MSDDPLARATDRVDDVLSDQLYLLNRGRVLKWVAVFEYLDADGDRQIGSMASPDLMKWDVGGMLHHVLQNDLVDTLRQGDPGGDDAHPL